MNIRLAIVAGEFNAFISKALLSACLKELQKAKVNSKNITTVWVPGSFEIPVVAKRLASKKTIDAVICIGAVIRGETYHFEVIANESAQGMMHVALATGKPVINAVLTTDTIAQAQARAGSKDNKGRDAAQAALAMVALMRKLK